MKRADRDAWCADLRANPDKQGQEFLSSPSGDCCLGRLALLKGVPTRPGTGRDASLVFMFPSGPGSSRKSFPPHPWLKGLGLPGSVARGLAAKNDLGVSFTDIADIIEDIVPVEE